MEINFLWFVYVFFLIMSIFLIFNIGNFLCILIIF